MGAEDSKKKLKRMKKTKKRSERDSEIGGSQLSQEEGKLNRGKKEDRRNKKKKKNSSIDGGKEVEGEMFGSLGTIDEMHESSGGNRKSKKLRKDKRKKGNVISSGVEESDDQHTDGDEDGISGKVDMESEPAEDKLLKSRKKKKKIGESVNKIGEFQDKDDAPEHQSGKSKKREKMKKKSQFVKEKASPDNDNLLEKSEDNEEDDVYQMSSGDEDYSKGMQKWITQYHQSRPGLKVLQERIDEFITAHEAKEEQARVEREAQAAEGGWTVVVHHKGRKKTTDAESGVAVGSVAAAAVLDKMAKKKKKDVGVDFYRFQKREAHRNEIMTLQSKFEQDKKRIQQMRAARKFRPY